MMYNQFCNRKVVGILLCIITVPACHCVDSATALVELVGTDFQGGGARHFSSDAYGNSNVNYIYARPNEDASRLESVFDLKEPPTEPMYLHLRGLDDDGTNQCNITISLNDTVIFQGANEFDFPKWQDRKYKIGRNVLKAGQNKLLISNIESAGPLGNTPWFMIALAAIAQEDFNLRVPPHNINNDFFFNLPAEKRSIPEPLPVNRTQPGFKFRGTKGWGWTPQQYLEEIPYLKKYKLNFLMNCYLSTFSECGTKRLNEWWKPMSDDKKRGFSEIIRQCHLHEIIFCFAFHPQIHSPRPLDPTSKDDLNTFFQHFAWAQDQGVRWFSVSWDDVSWGDKGAAIGGQQHSEAVNFIFNRLRSKDPEAQLIFCPVAYRGDGTSPDDRAYLTVIAKHMHPDVYIFWTGDAVVAPHITRQAAQSYRDIVGHRLFLWDNYPVNDNAQTLHLGPVTGRDSDLCEVIDGYMSNPHCKENDINRIPLATCADYAYNPWDYNPERAIGQAILSLTDNSVQQRFLKDLVEAYPGMLIFGGRTNTNPVRERYNRIAALNHPACTLDAFIDYIGDLKHRFDQNFPDQFAAAKQALQRDIDWMKEKYRNRYGCESSLEN